jgi:putative glycosyltransferase (TIGR04372 family)
MTNRRLHLFVVKVHDQFAHLILALEKARGERLGKKGMYIVVVKCQFRHSGFGHLYRRQTEGRIYWSIGFSALFGQAFLMLPRRLIDLTLITSDNLNDFALPEEPLAPSRKLVRLRGESFKKLGLQQSEYVAVSIYVSSRDEMEDEGYRWKSEIRETEGDTFGPSVDYLRNRNIEVFLLGVNDDGKARIPRKIPRLADVGKMGGMHEVAIASGCKYFWTDDSGGQWTKEPFKLPTLVTNAPEALGIADRFNAKYSEKLFVVPLRFQTPSGHMLSIEEGLTFSHRRFEMFAKGNITCVRNTSDDLVAAHTEVLARLDGTWLVSEEELICREKINKLFERFPEFLKGTFLFSFLSKYPHLLE